MKLNALYDNNLKRKHKKCVGRGGGCGKGKTCGRGHKGQKARTGKAIKGFEGGQMPIERRLPKRGFNSTRKDYTIVSLRRIQEAIDKKKLDPMQVIDKDVLKLAGLLKKVSLMGIKILSDGEITSKISLKVEAISLAAKEKLINNGSTVHVV